MLVRCQSVFLVTGQEGINATGRGADPLELLVQRLVVLDILLGLRPSDRQVFDDFQQPLPQGGPIGARFAGPREDFRLGLRGASRLLRATSLTTVSFCRTSSSVCRSFPARSRVSFGTRCERSRAN